MKDCILEVLWVGVIAIGITKMATGTWKEVEIHRVNKKYDLEMALLRKESENMKKVLGMITPFKMNQVPLELDLEDPQA